MIQTTTIDWSARHQASRQRAMAGGGKLYAHTTTTCVVFSV